MKCANHHASFAWDGVLHYTAVFTFYAHVQSFGNVLPAQCSPDHVTLEIKTSIMTAHNNRNRAMISLTEAYREKKRQEFFTCIFCCFSALLIKHDPNIT